MYSDQSSNPINSQCILFLEVKCPKDVFWDILNVDSQTQSFSSQKPTITLPSSSSSMPLISLLTARLRVRGISIVSVLQIWPLTSALLVACISVQLGPEAPSVPTLVLNCSAFHETDDSAKQLKRQKKIQFNIKSVWIYGVHKWQCKNTTWCNIYS